MPQRHVELESCFFMDLMENYILRKARCTENIINTLVFNRFHVYRKIEFWVSRDCFLELFWEVSVDLGVLEGVEMLSNFR